MQTIKSMQSYRLYVEVFPQDHREDDDPKTPDPFDRSISKRQWKWNVEKWRLQLKSRCVYSRAVMLQCRQYTVDNGEPLSTDGCCKEEGRTPLRMESMDTLRTRVPVLSPGTSAYTGERTQRPKSSCVVAFASVLLVSTSSSCFLVGVSLALFSLISECINMKAACCFVRRVQHVESFFWWQTLYGSTKRYERCTVHQDSWPADPLPA